MTFTVRNITELDNVISTLIIDGYSNSEIQERTKLFHEGANTMNNVDYLISSKRLEIYQCLSQGGDNQQIKNSCGRGGCASCC